MPLQRHHKILIGGLSSLVIIYMIINGIFLYMLYLQLDANYNALNKKITEMQAETENKIIELSENVLQTREDLGTTISSLNKQIDQVKAQTSADFSDIIEESIPSVVTIKTDVAQGTGFIIHKDGYIVTNAHVLSGAKFANAITYEQEILPMDLIGYNQELDIALLKIEGGYTPLKLGDSDKVDVGERVIAIGNPLGLSFSVTEGIVSAVNRDAGQGIPAYIQTDAALNPGNSGGPLIDVEGEVIGINNFKVTGDNIGFALESNYIKSILNDISQENLNQTIIN